MSRFRPTPLIGPPAPPPQGRSEFSDIARVVSQAFGTATTGARATAAATDRETQDIVRTRRIDAATDFLRQDEIDRDRVKQGIVNEQLKIEYDELRDVERFGWSALQTKLSTEEKIEKFRTYRFLDPQNRNAVAQAITDDLASTDYMRILREEAEWNRNPNNQPNTFNSDEAFARILGERDLPIEIAELYQSDLLKRLRSHSEARFNAQSRLENQQIIQKAENRLKVSGKLWLRKQGDIDDIEDAARSLLELQVGPEGVTESSVNSLMAASIGPAISTVVDDPDQVTALTGVRDQLSEIDNPELQQMLQLYDAEQKINGAIQDFNTNQDIDLSQTLKERAVDAKSPEQITALRQQLPNIQDETIRGTTDFDLLAKGDKLTRAVSAERRAMAALVGGPPTSDQGGTDSLFETLVARGNTDEGAALGIFSAGMPLPTRFREQMEAGMDPQFPNFMAPLSFLRRLEGIGNPAAAERFVKGLPNGELLEIVGEITKDHPSLEDPFVQGIIAIAQRADAGLLLGDIDVARAGGTEIPTVEGQTVEIEEVNAAKAAKLHARRLRDKLGGIGLPVVAQVASAEGPYGKAFWAHYSLEYINGMTNPSLGVVNNKAGASKRAERIASRQAANKVSLVSVPGASGVGGSGGMFFIDRVPGLGTAADPGPLLKQFDKDINRYYRDRTNVFQWAFGANVDINPQQGFMKDDFFVIPQIDEDGVVSSFMQWDTDPEVLEDRLVTVTPDDSRFLPHLAELNRFAPGEGFRSYAWLDKAPESPFGSVEENEKIRGTDLTGQLANKAERIFFSRQGRWPDYRNESDVQQLRPLYEEVRVSHGYTSWGAPKNQQPAKQEEPKAQPIPPPIETQP